MAIDHQALKTLPQLSGKLAQCAMTIQELDVKVLHRSGKILMPPLPGKESKESAPFRIIASSNWS